MVIVTVYIGLAIYRELVTRDRMDAAYRDMRRRWRCAARQVDGEQSISTLDC